MNGSLPPPRYKQYRPSAGLRDFVEVIWVQECEAVQAGTPTTIVPTGRVELIFHYGDPFVQLQGNSEQIMARCHVVGQQKRPIVLNATGTTGIVIVRFKPWGAFTLLGNVLADINNRLVDLELIWSRIALDDLVNRLIAAPTPRTRAGIVDAFVLSQLQSHHVDGLSVESVNTINRVWGRETVTSIASHFDLGRRQFNRRFTKNIGASPKQLSRVLRAQKAIACIRAGLDVQDVIGRCGFSDQSHLIRDVVDHSNRSPAELTNLATSNACSFFNTSEVSAFCGTTYL
jgi:AraC-like DNA-binding protein